jgi:hypothetical protein
MLDSIFPAVQTLSRLSASICSMPDRKFAFFEIEQSEFPRRRFLFDIGAHRQLATSLAMLRYAPELCSKPQ